MIMNTCRRLAAKIAGSDKTYRPTATHDRKQRRDAKRRSKQLDHALKADWKNERTRIKLLLLGKYKISSYDYSLPVICTLKASGHLQKRSLYILIRIFSVM